MRKIFMILLACLLVVSTAGCGKDQSALPGQQETVQQTAAPTQAPTEAPTVYVPETTQPPAGPQLLREGFPAESVMYYQCVPEVDFCVFMENDRYGLVNYQGEILLSAQLESVDIRQPSPGSQERKLYAYDANGRGCWVLPDGTLQEEFLGGFGFPPSAQVYWMDGPVMFDEVKGKVPFSYEAYAGYYHGASVLGTITEGTHRIIAVQEISNYEEVTDMGMTYCVVETVSEKYALLDLQTGKLLTDFVYDNCGYSGFVEGILPVCRDGKWGYINEELEMITDFVYDVSDVTPWGNEHMYSALNGYILVRQGDMWGLIDTRGNVIMEVIYEGISQVNPQGLFWAKENGTWSLYQLTQ